MGSSTSIDGKGRVTIPKEIRERLGLKPHQTLSIDVRKQEIVLRPAARYEEFVSQLKGCVKGGKVKPGEVKEIWGVTHAHN